LKGRGRPAIMAIPRPGSLDAGHTATDRM